MLPNEPIELCQAEDVQWCRLTHSGWSDCPACSSACSLGGLLLLLGLVHEHGDIRWRLAAARRSDRSSSGDAGRSEGAHGRCQVDAVSLACLPVCSRCGKLAVAVTRQRSVGGRGLSVGQCTGRLLDSGAARGRCRSIGAEASRRGKGADTRRAFSGQTHPRGRAGCRSKSGAGRFCQTSKGTKKALEQQETEAEAGE